MTKDTDAYIQDSLDRLKGKGPHEDEATPLPAFLGKIDRDKNLKE